MSPRRSKKKATNPDASDILVFEIKKKLKVMNAWIDFLKKFNLWNIQNPIRYKNHKLYGLILLESSSIPIEKNW